MVVVDTVVHQDRMVDSVVDLERRVDSVVDSVVLLGMEVSEAGVMEVDIVAHHQEGGAMDSVVVMGTLRLQVHPNLSLSRRLLKSR